MKSIFSRGLGFISSFVLCVASFVPITYASPQTAFFQNANAARYAYFAKYNLLPILLPGSQEPGSLYRNPDALTPFYSAATCFHGRIKPKNPSEVIFDDDLNATKKSLQTSTDIKTAAIVNVFADNNVVLTDTVNIAFASAKSWSLEEGAIMDYVTKHKNEKCSAEILNLLESNDFQSSIPWIMANVIKADMSFKFGSSHKIDTGVGVNIKTGIRRIDPSANLTLQDESSSEIASVTRGIRSIAYAPAFISSKHIKELANIQNQDWFDKALNWYFSKDPQKDLFEEIKKDFPQKWRQVKAVKFDMRHGKPVKFDPKNAEHLKYIQRLDIVLAFSTEIDREHSNK